MHLLPPNREQIKAVCDFLPDTAARIAFVLRKLVEFEEPWLMVFDNYDDPASFSNIRDYMPEGHYGDVLGTSRHLDTSELGFTDEHHFVELSGLEPVAASRLLLHHCRVQVGDESEVKLLWKDSDTTHSPSHRLVLTSRRDI
jgi:hypothetical protein